MGSPTAALVGTTLEARRNWPTAPEKVDDEVGAPGADGELLDPLLLEQAEADAAGGDVHELRGGVERERAGGLGVGARAVGDGQAGLAVDAGLGRLGLAPVLDHERRGVPVDRARQLAEAAAGGVEDVGHAEDLAGPDGGGARGEAGVGDGVGDDARGAPAVRGDELGPLARLDGEGRDLERGAGAAGAHAVGQDGGARKAAVDDRGLRGAAGQREGVVGDGGQAGIAVRRAVLEHELHAGRVVGRALPVRGLRAGDEGEAAEQEQGEETAHGGHQSLPFFLGGDFLSVSISW